MTKRREVFVSLGALAASVVLLTSLWGYLATSTIYQQTGRRQGAVQPVRDPPRQAAAMVKLLQIVTLLCGIVGSVMGISLLYIQAGRDTGDSSATTLTVAKPCLDANGEPTC